MKKVYEILRIQESDISECTVMKVDDFLTCQLTLNILYLIVLNGWYRRPSMYDLFLALRFSSRCIDRRQGRGESWKSSCDCQCMSGDYILQISNWNLECNSQNHRYSIKINKIVKKGLLQCWWQIELEMS